MLRSLFLTTGALVCFASGAFADVTMKLTGPPPGPSMGGVYTSPYTATINGVSTLVICDDFFTDVSINTPAWQATATNLASLQGESAASTVVKFDQGNAVTQQKDYTTAAYLAVQLLATNQSTVAGQVVAGQLSFALWGLFDSAAFNSLSGTNLTAAQGYLSAAKVASASLSPSYYSNVTIYTPSAANAAGQNASQEYITVAMAEPPSPALFAFDLLAVAGIILFVRRRKAATQIAG